MKIQWGGQSPPAYAHGLTSERAEMWKCRCDHNTQLTTQKITVVQYKL